MTALSFVNHSSSYAMAKQEAELYMRIYQYAAEDFRNVNDCGIAHKAQATYNNSIETRVVTLTSQMNTHTHMVSQSPAGILPSNPPTIPMTWTTGVMPPIPVSTALRAENIGGNFVIPSMELSYIDMSVTGINLPYTSFRRSLSIPITADLSEPLIKQE